MSLPESDRQRLKQHPLKIKATPAPVQHVLPYIEGKSEEHTMACAASLDVVRDVYETWSAPASELDISLTQCLHISNRVDQHVDTAHSVLRQVHVDTCRLIAGDLRMRWKRHDSHACAISLSVRQTDETLPVEGEILALNTIITFDAAKHKLHNRVDKEIIRSDQVQALVWLDASTLALVSNVPYSKKHLDALRPFLCTLKYITPDTTKNITSNSVVRNRFRPDLIMALLVVLCNELLRERPSANGSSEMSEPSASAIIQRECACNHS